MADVAVNTLPTDASPVSADTVLTVKDADGELVRVDLSTIKTLFNIPSNAADVGAVAVAQGVAHAGEFCVVGSDGNITTVTMTAWAGGSY